MDILAKETFPSTVGTNSKHMVGQLILTVECKSLPDHGWIFTQGKINQDFWYFSLIRDSNDFQENLMPKEPLNELIGTSSFLERITNTKPKDQLKTNNQTNNIHNASLKLIKLTRDLINEDERQAKILYRSYTRTNEIVFFKIYQPLIVFAGNLYVKKVDMAKISSTKYLQLKRQYKTKAYNEDATIHVVSSKHLEEYLSLIRAYYMIGAQYIFENQNHIMDRVYEDLIHWDDFNPFKINV
jgi:hypothetical protein